MPDEIYTVEATVAQVVRFEIPRTIVPSEVYQLCSSEQDAAAIAAGHLKQRHPNGQLQSMLINGMKVIAFCDECDRAIFKNEKAIEHGNGVYCRECLRLFVKEEERPTTAGSAD